MTTLRTAIIVACLGAGLAGLLSADAATIGGSQMSARQAVWTEVKWPFPLDEWGTGQAFHCSEADCGVEASLYLRAKVGFCNCSTGVSDDPELERVGDLASFSPQFVALTDGHEIRVGWMKGRSRPYGIAVRYATPLAAVSIAFNDKCDVAVATVVADRARLQDAERLAVTFLNGDMVLRWAKAELGSDGI